MNEMSKKYLYNEETVRENMPAKAGVYRLIYEYNKKYYVFYAGQSEDLKERLLEHLRPAEPDECIKKYLQKYICFIRFVEIDLQNERDKREKKEIEDYSPSCNRPNE